jgi:apolipoprotein N-acyltransferase
MALKYYRYSIDFALALLSSLLLVVSFPKFDLGFLAWIGLLPILIATNGKGLKYTFILWFVCGLFFFGGIFYWTFAIPKYTVLHHSLLGLYLPPYFAFFGLAFGIISKRWGVRPALFAVPFIWVSLEYVRSNLSFVALPWALLAHSQYQYPVIIQIASVTGTYGLSFLIVLVNAAITQIIMGRIALWRGSTGSTNAPRWTRGRLSLPVATAVLLVVVLGYGQIALSGSTERRIIKASVLQGNISQERKVNSRRNAPYIMDRYAQLTRRAALDEPDLIIWPEAATPGFILKDVTLHQRMISIVREMNIYLLVGSSEYAKFTKTLPKDKKARSGNTALFFSPEGKILGQYLKIHLVPFGEYIPLEGIIDWPHFIVSKEGKIYDTPGQEHTLFNLKEAKFGVVICWEHVFADLFRTFVKNGADFMLNITNEGWFGDTAAPYQMLAISVFRAVENRRAIARAANTGISCFIDPHGRITGRVQDNQKKDTFVEGYLTGEIPISDHKTFYTKHGEVFAYICVAIALLMMAISFTKNRVGENESKNHRALLPR